MKIHDKEWSFNLTEKIGGFFHMVYRRKAPEATREYFQSLLAVKRIVELESCPKCNQKTVELDEFVKSTISWEAVIKCKNCQLQAIVNSKGLHFKNMAKGAGK